MPGLRSLLIRLGKENPDLGAQILAEAAASLGQKRPARLALAELRAWSLEEAARLRLLSQTAQLALNFVDPNDRRLRTFAEAARDLSAARLSRSQRHRAQALNRAAATLDAAIQTLALTRRPDAAAAALTRPLRAWRAVVTDEISALKSEIATSPEVPVAFVAGPVLLPTDRERFKGRRDLAQTFDHELTRGRPSPLLLYGQRRMGKSSLLNLLPLLLGTGTTVCTVNFQDLSTHEDRSAPHRLIAAAVHAALPGSPPPPRDASGQQVLTWLQSLDPWLRDQNRHLLLALDEVERWEDGLRAGWADTSLLDLLRAAGDRLQRTRVLLVTAWSLRSLGSHWVDHLISARSLRLDPLDPASARELLTQPVPDFPDIYPPGAVERLVTDTGGHPFLLQLVGDALVRRLNLKRARVATEEDIEDAVLDALHEADQALFSDLWARRSTEEQLALRRLAESDLEAIPAAVRKDLARDGFLTRDENALLIPLFAEWVRDQEVG